MKMLKDKQACFSSADTMTLRDYFAGQVVGVVVDNAPALRPFDSNETVQSFAAVAYRIADAMLREREAGR